MPDPTVSSRLLDALDGVAITDAELASLIWLSGWEKHTVENLATVIGRARRSTDPTAPTRLFPPGDTETGELTPAQQQAEFLTALAGHLRDHPHLAAVQLTDTIGILDHPRRAQVTGPGNGVAALARWARSLGTHTLQATQLARHAVSVRTTGLVGTIDTSPLTVSAIIEGLVLPYDWTRQPGDDTELSVTALEYFAAHGALPEAGGSDG